MAYSITVGHSIKSSDYLNIIANYFHFIKQNSKELSSVSDLYKLINPIHYVHRWQQYALSFGESHQGFIKTNQMSEIKD